MAEIIVARDGVSGPEALDVKLHDIPGTVACAVNGAADLDIDMLTVHASEVRGCSQLPGTRQPGG